MLESGFKNKSGGGINLQTMEKPLSIIWRLGSGISEEEEEEKEKRERVVVDTLLPEKGVRAGEMVFVRHGIKSEGRGSKRKLTFCCGGEGWGRGRRGGEEFSKETTK